MKQLKHLFLPVLVAFLCACNGGSTTLASNDGGISGTGDGSSKSSISGASYKGPLAIGSLITIKRVIDGVLSNHSISESILSNKGDYKIDVVNHEINHSIISMTTSGQFYDENTGLYSDGLVELKALVQVSVAGDNEQVVYVNSLTTLAHDVALQLLSNGETYEEALRLAENRVLTLLLALTGNRNITEPFSNLSLINTSATHSGDNSFLLYLSSLLTKAAHIKSNKEPGFTVTSLFEILNNHVINNTPINDSTLILLQKAHEQLEPTVINQNLSSILSGNNIATVEATIALVTPGITPPTEFDYAFFNDTYRFCYDGASQCDQQVITGAVDSNDLYSYELQTSIDSSFASPRAYQTPANNFALGSSKFISGTRYYARIRKVWPDQQYSKWAELNFVAR